MENVEKTGIIISFLVTSDTIDCPLPSFSTTKKLLEDPRDQKLVASLLQNSLDTDTSKTTGMTDFLSGVEPQVEVSISQEKQNCDSSRAFNYHI